MIKKIINELSNDASAVEVVAAMDDYIREVKNRIEQSSVDDIDAALTWWNTPEEEGGVSLSMKLLTIVGLYNTVVDQTIDFLELGEQL